MSEYFNHSRFPRFPDSTLLDIYGISAWFGTCNNRGLNFFLLFRYPTGNSAHIETYRAFGSRRNVRWNGSGVAYHTHALSHPRSGGLCIMLSNCIICRVPLPVSTKENVWTMGRLLPSRSSKWIRTGTASEIYKTRSWPCVFVNTPTFFPASAALVMRPICGLWCRLSSRVHCSEFFNICAQTTAFVQERDLR